jgi:radical SAM superfamily enzyme YgiQ (UPF0313 family)
MRKPLFLLVYPEVPDTYWSYKHALSFVGKKALMPPLGLATVAAMIPDKYECRIIDCNVEPLPQALIRQAELVLVSAMIVQADSLQRVIGRCRAAGVRIVAGGPYPTSCHEQISGVDYFVLGEAESVFPEFLADYERGMARRIYRCEKRPDLSAAPVPRLDLFKVDLYDTIPLQFSRGCPFDCEFCDIVHLYGHKPRTKSPAQFLREMDAAYATGFRGSLFIVDDNFIGNKRAAKELLRSVAEWQRVREYPFVLCTEASIDLAADDELLDLMVESGFSMVFIGIESPDRESLAAAGKWQNLQRDVGDGVRTIQERGIEVTGGFIIGFDSDPPSIFDLQIDYVQKLAIPTAMVGLLMALPNTRLHARLEKEGRLLSRANGNNTHHAELNFEPRMDRATLEAGYYRVLATIYSPRRYFARCLKVLSRYPHRRKAAGLRRPIKWREIVGFCSSLSRQLFSLYGLAYLGYMIRAMARRPDLSVAIVTMAVQGHHYFTITRSVLAERRRETAPHYRRVSSTTGRGTIPQFVPEPSSAL